MAKLMMRSSLMALVGLSMKKEAYMRASSRAERYQGMAGTYTGMAHTMRASLMTGNIKARANKASTLTQKGLRM